MKEIVTYHNDINKISFPGFNEKELNVFFALIFLAKNQGIRELSISFSELKTLINDDGKNRKRFIATLVSLNDKLASLRQTLKIDGKIYTFSLFNHLIVDDKEDILMIEVNKIFAFMLNDLIENFTQFELKKMINLKSAYSKNMFRLLKQWESKKEKKFSVDELRSLLTVPVSYNTSKFNEKVLNPIKEELPTVLPKFDMTKNKNGVKIVGYTFTWGEEEEIIEYTKEEEEIIAIPQKIMDIIKDVCDHNRFIKSLLDDEDNLIKLFNKFYKTEETKEALIKGLKYSQKDIQREVTLNYLITNIKIGAKAKKVEQKIKIVDDKLEIKDSLNQNDYRQTTLDEDPRISKIKGKEEKLVGKIEISEDEYKEKYQEYLNQYNAVDNPFTRKAFDMMYQVVKEENKKIEDNEKNSFCNPFFKNIIDSNLVVNFVVKDKKNKKIFKISDIPLEKLLGKNGKKLSGGALKSRIDKVLKEMNGE